MSLRCTFMLSTVLLACLPSLPAQDPPAEKPLTGEQKEKLKERDRLRAEYAALWKEQKYQEAVRLFEKSIAVESEALGLHHLQVAKSIETVAAIYERLELFAVARQRRELVVEIIVKLHGKDHWLTTNVRLALEHVDVLEKLEPAQRRQLDEARALHAQAGELDRQGKSGEGIALEEKSAGIYKQVLGEKHLFYATSLSNLGNGYYNQGDYAKAEPLLRQALEIGKQVLGEKHPAYATSLSNLGNGYYKQRDYAKGEPLLRQALEIRKQVLGEKHPDYANSLENLANLHFARGDYAKAEPLLRHALEIRKQVLGEKHSDYANSLENLANLHFARGDYAKAEPFLRQALEIRKQVLGEKHPHTLDTMAKVHFALGDYAKAEPLFRQALEIRKQVLGENHPDYANSLDNLAKLRQQEKLQERNRLRKEVDALWLAQKVQEAAALFEKSIDAEVAALGVDHPEVTRSLERLAATYESIEVFDKARQRREQVLVIKEKLHGKDHWQTTNARLALEHGDGRRKLEPAQRRQLDEASRASSQAVDLSQQGRVGAALGLAKSALATHKQLLGENHHEVATSLCNLAALHQMLGELAKAEPLLCQALDIRKQVLGEKHPDVAAALNNLAELRRAQGELTESELLCKQALEIKKQTLGEMHPDFAETLANLANVYRDQGDYAKAEPLYRQTSVIFKQVLGERHPNYAGSLYNLAMLNQTQGAFAKAEPLYRQASEISKQVLGEKHPNHAQSLDGLAGLYYLQGDYAKAEPHFRQALDIRRQVLGEKHPDVAAALNNLAILHIAQGRYAEAAALFRQGVEISRQVQGEKHPDYARGLHNLAALHKLLGDNATAETIYRQTLEVLKSNLGEKHPDYAKTLMNLAGLYGAQGKYDRAEPLLRQASETLKQVLCENNHDHAISLSNLAMLHVAQGDHAKADSLFRQVLASGRKRIDLGAAVQSERQQLAMIESLRYELDEYLSACQDGKLPALLGYREMLLWKGAVLVKQRQLQLAQRDPKLAPLAEELRQVSGQLATLSFASPSPSQREAFARQIVALAERKERLEAALADRSALFGEGQQLAQLTPEQLQKALPADSVLVDFLEYSHSAPAKEKKGKWNFERRLTAFLVPATGDIVRLDLGPAAPIAKAVDDWRMAIVRGHRPTGEAGDPASSLRKLIWDPLEEHVKNAKLVLLSPDGIVSQLPFAALPGSKAGTYLIEDQSLVLAPAPQLLPALLSAPKRDDAGIAGLLIIGDVDYGGDAGQPDNNSPSRGFAIVSNALPTAPEAKRPKWSPLAATGLETDAIGRLFQQRFTKAEINPLRKAGATEAAFRQLAPKHRYLHVATHGFFADAMVRSALYPTEKLTDPFLRQQFGDKGFIGHNPELLSGLVLAGANSPIKSDHDDGILTALEIRNLDLDNVELAVLSACETGLGAVAGGEGVLGLQRAFQTAGARTVVTSLWQIPDNPTQLLMERFYTNLWQKKMSKMEALREAQLWMLREGIKQPGIMRGLKLDELKSEQLKDGRLPPVYWAAFVLSGDWR